MAKSKPLTKIVKVVGWITGILVALAVGFGMAQGTLSVPIIEPIVPFAGWLVIILTLIEAIIAIIDAIK